MQKALLQSEGVSRYVERGKTTSAPKIVLLFCHCTDFHHITANLSTELRCAVHDKFTLLNGFYHIVDGHKYTESAVKIIKAHCKEGKSAFIFASAGFTFTCFNSDVAETESSPSTFHA